MKTFVAVLFAKCCILCLGSDMSLPNENMLELCTLMSHPSSFLIIVTDDHTGSDVTVITDGLSRRSKLFVLMNVHEIRLYLEEKITQAIKKNSFTKIRSIYNIIIHCSNANITTLLQKMEELDAERGRGFIIRHFSSWLYICEDENNLLPGTLTIDNIAVIFKKNNRLRILTMVWGPYGREWRPVPYGGIKTDFQAIFPNSRHGFNGRRLQAAALSWPPFLISRITNGSEEFVGVGIYIMDYFAKKFNFTYTTISPQDKHWGTPDENGVWNGVVGMLQQNIADISLAPFSSIRERSEVMDFSFPMHYSTIRAIYKKLPVDPGRKWTLFTSIFQWKVYICGTVTIVGTGIMFALLELWNSRWEKDNWRKSLPDVLFYVINVPLRQGANVFPQSRPSKILFCSWWLFCLVLTAIYTGNLTAVFTVEREKVPFSTIEELVANEDYEVVTAEGSFLQFALQSSNKTVLLNLLEKIKRTNINNSIDVMIWRQRIRDRFRQGGFALLTTEDGIVTTLGEDCDVSRMDGNIMSIYSSLAFPLHSPLAQLFYSDLQVMFESGLISFMKNYWTKSEEKCSDTQETRVQIRIDDLLAAIVVCACWCFVAGVVLLLEITVSKLF